MALSTKHSQRGSRSVQMVLGVLLGIATGSVISAVIGVSTPALGLIVLVTLLIARAMGVSFLGDGMMFGNQAAASALIVAVLNHSGTGAERALDAAVGGAVALLIGVVLFPSQPLPRLRAAERAVLGSLATALDEVASLLRTGTWPDPAWTVAAANDVHQRLAELTAARSTAQKTVRIAPRRWRQRAIVDAEDRRLARLDLLATTALGIVRAATNALEDRQEVPASLDRRIAALAAAIGELGSTPQPWPPDLRRAVFEAASPTIERESSERPDWVAVIASTIRTTARDLEAVIEPDAPLDPPSA